MQNLFPLTNLRITLIKNINKASLSLKDYILNFSSDYDKMASSINNVSILIPPALAE